MSANSKPQGSIEAAIQDFVQHLRLHRRYSDHTLVAYKRDTGRFAAFLRSENLPSDPAEVSPKHVAQFAASLSHLAPATVCRGLDALSSFFAFLHDQGLVRDNPAAAVPRPRREHRLPTIATPQDVRALSSAAQSPLEHVVVALLAYLGIRRAELLGLDVTSFSMDLATVRIDGKGGKQRQLPVCEPLRDTLREYLGARSSDADALLLNQEERRLGCTSLQRLWRRLIRRAGLEGRGLTLHSVRHGTATAWLDAGADVKCVQLLLGHRHLETTSKYLHVTDATLREAVNLLPGYLADSKEDGHDGAPSAPT